MRYKEIKVEEKRYHVWFGGTNKGTGRWDVYVEEFERGGNKEGYLGDAQKGPRGEWYAMGKKESGPFRTRQQVVVQLIKDES